MQLIGQQVIEKINANAIDDASILSYNNLKTTQPQPNVEPARSDYSYFKSLISRFNNASIEIYVYNVRPFPVKVRVYWRDGSYNHHLDFNTFILPH